jgi:hypothetical protein
MSRGVSGSTEGTHDLHDLCKLSDCFHLAPALALPACWDCCSRYLSCFSRATVSALNDSLQNGPIRIATDYSAYANQYSWNHLADYFWLDQPVYVSFAATHCTYSHLFTGGLASQLQTLMATVSSEHYLRMKKHSRLLQLPTKIRWRPTL